VLGYIGVMYTAAAMEKAKSTDPDKVAEALEGLSIGTPVGKLTIDAKTRTVTFRDNSITLTKREFQLLAVLMSRPDKYFSADQLPVEAWHDDRLPEESMRTYISRVRKKLKVLGNGAEVVNKSRKGYTLTFEPPAK